MPGSPAPYPADREADIVLRDGSTLHVRPIRRDDGSAIRAFLADLSSESIVFRFFSSPNLEWVANWSVDVDYADRFALVAETGQPPRVVAHAAYVREMSESAEVAFLVADEFQGHGISTTLLAHLAAVAERHGITTFTAQVLPANHRMIEVFRESGLPVELVSRPDAIEVVLPTSLSPQALERFEERERRAAVAAVAAVLAPRSVAVVGASRRRGTVGAEILRNLLGSGFTGPVYAVNDRARTVQSLRAHPSVSAIGEPVDLAVVVVPAEAVPSVARDCAQARVRALVVISSGFAETGEQGAARQRELVSICRASGMRLVGPNCLGVLNTAQEVRLDATFARSRARPGSLGFMSQSGGLGIAIIEAAGRMGLGLSSFVSVGNKADLSGNDMLCYWECDPNTRVGMLYLESFGNPRKFARLAPRFARRKPLLAVKSGRSTPGARATTSHTGVLLASSDVTVDALFRQAGVIRTDTLYELFAVAQLLDAQPIPRDDRVAILTNAGGPGVMCADACHAEGVAVPDLPAALRERLRRLLPSGASLGNPIDMLAGATAEHYRRAIETLVESGTCGTVLAIFIPSLVADAPEVARAIRSVAERRPPVALAAVFMTDADPPRELGCDRVRVPGYEFPEDAARAVALAARHGRWRTRPVPEPVELEGIRPESAAAVISEQFAAKGAGWLEASRAHALLDAYGLAVTPRSRRQPGEVELIVGVAADRSFGPVIACGAGGPAAELLGDVAVRITPLTSLDAEEMLRSLRTFPLLDGYQGATPCDLEALRDVLLRVGAMVESHREIVELDCNPVIASPSGATVAGARVRVEPVPPRAPVPSLQA
jgi:acetyl coenzyme A synthetase (ADP forming)-like protein